MKIVLAPNAFKGCLTASEAAAAMAKGVARVIPDAETLHVPVADGGDGLVDVAVEALSGESRVVQVTGPRGDAVEAAFCQVRQLGLAAGDLPVGLSLRSAARRERRGPRLSPRAGSLTRWSGAAGAARPSGVGSGLRTSF